MKKLFVLLTLIFTSLKSYAQGTLNLSNLQPGQEIWLWNAAGAAGPGSIPGSYAQLFLGSEGTGGPPLTPLVNFFTEPGATQWLVPTDFVVPGAAPGTIGTFYLRVSAPGW